MSLVFLLRQQHHIRSARWLLAVALSLLLLALLPVAPIAPALAATDAAADVFLNIFQEVHNSIKQTQWRFNRLQDWVDTKGAKVCPLVSGMYDCGFADLVGALRSDRYGDLPASLPLRKLHITAPNSTALRGVFSLSALPSSLESLEMVRVAAAANPGIADATLTPGRLPISLKRLIIDEVSHGFRTMNFANLPANLTTIKLSNTQLRGDLAGFSMLPAGLDSLDVRQNDFTCRLESFAGLPPNITSLWLNENPRCTGNPMDELGNLPRKVVNFGLWNHPNLDGDITVGLTELPPRMQRLHIGKTKVSSTNLDLTQLPPTMIELFIQESRSITSPSGVDLSKLPCSLQKIRLRGCKIQGEIPLDDISICVDEIDIGDAFVVGDIKLPARGSLVWRNSTLGTLKFDTNQGIKGAFDGARLHRALSYIDGHTCSLTSLDGMDALPGGLTYLTLYRNGLGNNMTTVSPGGEIVWSKMPRGLKELHVSENALNGSDACNLTGAPASLFKFNCNTNRLTGAIDFRGRQFGSLNLVYCANNLFTTLHTSSSTLFIDAPKIEFIQLHQNYRMTFAPSPAGSLMQLPELPGTTKKFYIGQTNLSARIDRFFLRLPGGLDTLRMERAAFTASYVVDISKLPYDTLTELDLRFQRYPAFRYTRIRINSRAQVPKAWQWPFVFDNARGWALLLQFCDLFTRGNAPMEFRLCNFTGTETRTLVSPTPTRSHNASLSETESDEGSATESEPLTRTRTRSRSMLDPTGNWMLNVVLANVQGLPRSTWELFPMRMWTCERYVVRNRTVLPHSGGGIAALTVDTTRTERYPCCPTETDPATGRTMHRCSFAAPLVGNGSVDVRFPPLYPMTEFSLRDAPNLRGTVDLAQMPSALRSLEIDRTAIGATSLPLAALPPTLTYFSMCDNSNVYVADITFGGMHPRLAALRTLRLCGSQVQMRQRAFRFAGLPAGLVALDLSRLALGQQLPSPALELPPSLRYLDLSGNRFDAVSALLLPATQQPARGLVDFFAGMPPRNNLTLVNLSNNWLAEQSLDVGAMLRDQLIVAASNGTATNANVTNRVQVLDLSKNRLRGMPNFTLWSNVSGSSGGGGAINASGNGGVSIQELYFHENGFSAVNPRLSLLPQTLRRLTLRGNGALRGRFEADAPLPPLLRQRLRAFCYDDVFPGTQLWYSMTCGDRTLSRSRSEGTRSASRSRPRTAGGTETVSPAATETRDRRGGDASATELATPSAAGASFGHSASLSRHTASASLSPGSATLLPTRSRSNESSASATHNATRTVSLPAPPALFRRDPALVAAMNAGAAIALLAAPALAAAATLVSRQTAISRAFGGKNGTCGGPTREDPLAFFEDPLGLDLDPLRRDCTGYLAGVLLGNLAVGLGAPLLLLVLRALHSIAVRKRIPTLLECAGRWVGELTAVVLFGLLLPPAVVVMLVSTTRCSWGVGGAVTAFLLLTAGFAVYHFLWRRERHERCCPTVYRRPKAADGGCFRFKAALLYLFAPAGTWVWKPFERLPRMQAEARAKVEALQAAAKAKQEEELVPVPVPAAAQRQEQPQQQRQQQNEEQAAAPPAAAAMAVAAAAPAAAQRLAAVDSDADSLDEFVAASVASKIQSAQPAAAAASSSVAAPSSPAETKRPDVASPPPPPPSAVAAAATVVETAAAAPPQDAPPTEQTVKQRKDGDDQDPTAIDDDGGDEESAQQRYQELRYELVQRWIDKSNAKSWWFLSFEFALRGVMALAPGIAEATPPQYSCLVMRLIYLLCINALLIAAVGRRPFLARALFLAVVVATVAEITVLVVLLAGFGDGDDGIAGDGGLLSVIMQASQYVALSLILGAELYEFVLERCCEWARGEVLLPPLEKLKRKKNNKKKRGGDEEDEDDEDGEATDPQASSSSRADADAAATATAPMLPLHDGSHYTGTVAVAHGKRRIGLTDIAKQQDDAERRLREREAAARERGVATVNDDGDGDLFDVLDRRLRQAYRELVSEDIQVVEPAEKFHRLRLELDEYMDL